MRWPDSLEPQSMEWGLVSNDRLHTSPLSNSQQVVEMPGSFWQCTLRYNVLSREMERELTAILGRLRGRVGTIDIPAWTRFYDRPSVGSITVTSGNVNSYQIGVNGINAGASAFDAGDYITIEGQLFEVVEPVTATGTGAATIQVNKRLRANMVPGTAVEYLEPYCTMRRDDESYRLSVAPISSSTSISLREAF